MRGQSEQLLETNAAQRPTAPMPIVTRCSECGEVDEDIRAGVTVCRRCVATGIALPAHTD